MWNAGAHSFFGRIVAFLTALALLAGAGGNLTLAQELVSQRQENLLKRAKDYGFVPEALWEQPDEIIKMSELCQMLSALIAPFGERCVDKWNELAVIALQSDETVQMDDALLAIFEAAVAMGIQNNQGMGNQREPNWEDIANSEDWWAGASMDYSSFPYWAEPIDDGNGHALDQLLLAALYAEDHWSLVDRSYIFPPEDDWTYDFARDITRRDAIRAVTVFAESDNIILDREAEYVRLEDVGTYDTEIIPDELLAQRTNLPAANQEHLPASWCGAGLSQRKDAEHAYWNFRESDIRILADNGLNFTRVFFDFTSLQYPYQTEAWDEVNRRELEELDQLIAWGIQYDVHIQLACFGALGYKCQGDKGFDRLSEEEWGLFLRYWEMLARRYAQIPSEYLSFDLLNEWLPDDTEQYDSFAELFGRIAQAIWSANPDRIVLHSLPGNPNPEWVEAIAAQGIALGIHPYNPPQLIDRTEEEYLAEAAWPIPRFGSVMEANEELTIAGDISGGTLKIWFEGAVQDALLSVYADGEPIGTIDPVSDTIDEYGDYREFTQAYELAVPEDTEVLTLRSSEESRWIRYNGLQFERNGRVMGIMPEDYQYFTDSASVNLYVDADGWSNADGLVYDADALYESAIEPIRDIAQRYHVGAMVNELGMFGDADVGEVARDYLDDLLRMLTECGLGWCYCEMEVGYLFDRIDGEHFVLKASPVSCTTYQYEGREETFWICEMMVDVLRKYGTKHSGA